MIVSLYIHIIDVFCYRNGWIDQMIPTDFWFSWYILKFIWFFKEILIYMDFWFWTNQMVSFEFYSFFNFLRKRSDIFFFFLYGFLILNKSNSEFWTLWFFLKKILTSNIFLNFRFEGILSNDKFQNLSVFLIFFKKMFYYYSFQND